MAHELRESLMQEQREQEQEEDREQERERPEEDDGAPGVGTGARAACAWAAGLGGCGEQERHIVVEIKTANALPLVKYACSDRVSALPTGPINAQRVGLGGVGGTRGWRAGRTHAAACPGEISRQIQLFVCLQLPPVMPTEYVT